MSSSLQSQRGEGRVQLFIWIIVFAMMVFALIKYVPVKVNIMEFEERCEEILRDAVNNPRRTRSPEQVENDAWDLAADLNLNLEDDAISCVRKGSSGFELTVQGSVEVDFIVYKHIQKVDFELSSTAF